MKVAVVTDCNNLYQKIKLCLLGKADVYRVISPRDAVGCDICIAQKQSPRDRTSLERDENHIYAKLSDDALIEKYPIGDESLSGSARIIYMGKGEELPIPFSYDQLFAAIGGEGPSRPMLLRGDGCAYLRGERIALTDVEFALFNMLYEANGEFVCRESLLRNIWNDDADGGVVNVYVHYLRQKLERGEKIIFTSRKHGYKIDAKYLGGEAGKCSE